MRLPIHGVEHYIRGNYFLDIKILICFLVISFDNIVTLSGKYVVRVVHQRYHGFLALEYKRLQNNYRLKVRAVFQQIIQLFILPA